MKTLKNEKILFAGLTGQIGYRLASFLAKGNDLWGLARFRDESKRKALESEGVKTHATDLANPDFSGLPDDFTYVINFAVYQESGLDFDLAFRVNAEGTGLLMTHCRKARTWLKEHNIAFAEVDISKDRAAALKVRGWAGGHETTPTFDFRGQIIVDFDPAKLQAALGVKA